MPRTSTPPDHLVLEHYFKTRYRTLAQIRSRLLETGKADPRQLSRIDALSAEVGAAYFELRSARAEVARRRQA